MAKKGKLTKSKSIYTLKKQHSAVNGGIIYENDHFTIIPNDGIYDSDNGTTLFSESNFKYCVKTNLNNKKKHVRGEFLENSSDNNDVWTLENIGEHTNISSETKIVLKPNYTSLKDFAYYGSAVELVKVTIKDIILKFPGGLYYYGANAPKIIINGDVNNPRYLISNEFEIDCWTGGGLVSQETVKNPMRILAASYMNYTIGDSNSECTSPVYTPISNCYNSIIGTVDFGAGIFEVYMNGDGQKYLVVQGMGKDKTPPPYGVIIKPKQKFIDEFWNNIDDFENVLLNRNTIPSYKAIFETPYATEKGYFYDNKSYIWPTVNNDGVTPDVTSGAFQRYLSSLLSLAEYHDSYDSDNIWRMMTHESIKNLDWTHNSFDNDESDFDNTGIGAMMRIYGRQFDDIKRYADNIKTVNSISYDEKNNVPDYFLSDKIDNSGWIAQHTCPFDSIDLNEIKINNIVLYTSGKTNDYVNTTFQRRLALSSKYIQTMKGTRKGIESILGMFGYTYADENSTSATVGTYHIEEYTRTVSEGLSYSEATYLRSFNDTLYESDTVPHDMYGYPVALVKYKDEDLTEKEYLIPWFDKKTDYVYPFYFQCKGGWGKISSKEIKSSLAPTTTRINSSDMSIPIYGETQPYIKYANNIDEMLNIAAPDLYKYMVCYVLDISDIEQHYKDENGFKPNIEDCSHYFTLYSVALSTRCGYVKTNVFDCYGWKNISLSEIYNCETDDARRVLYLESLTSEFNGNNPHIGNGHYDDGEEYLEKFTNLFGDLFKNGAFEYIKEANKKEYEILANGFGFKLDNEATIDNKKCAFFKDYTSNSTLTSLNEEDFNVWNSSKYTNISFPDTLKTIENIANESQANGIINVKNLTINFNVGDNQYLKKYLQTVVFKYLEEMIPSTAILEYRFNGEPVYCKGHDNISFDNDSFTHIRTAHAYINNSDGDDIIWLNNVPIPQINE